MATQEHVNAVQSQVINAEIATVNAYEAALQLAAAEGVSQGAIARISAAYTAIKVTMAAGHRALARACMEELGITPDPVPSPLSGGTGKEDD